MSLIARSILSVAAAAGALFGLANAQAIARDGLTAEDAAIGLPLPAIFFNLNGDQAGEDGSQSAARVATAATAREMLLKSPLDAFALWKRAEEVETVSPEQAAKLATLSGQITRRHFPSAAWLLESSVASGSVEGVLAQYDVLLTIWPAIGQRLLPQLISVAAEEPVILDMLLQMSPRPWYPAFLKTAAAMDGERFITHLNRYARSQPAEGRITAYSSYLAQLVDAGNVDGARRYIVGVIEVPDELLSDLQPSAITTDSRWGKVAWTPTRSPNASALLDRDGKTVDIEIGPDSAATVLSRTTLFKPGSYRLITAVTTDPMEETPRLTWTLSCPAKDQPMRRVQVASGGIEAKSSSGQTVDLAIPAGCDVQNWAIKALAGPGQATKRVRLTEFRMAGLEG